MKMIDVAEKDRTQRVAVARAELRCAPNTLKLLNEGRLEKGDALAAARLAGIMAAKRTPDILPLCHPIALSGVDVEVACDESGGVVRIEARVHAVDRTGVEMEALTAVMAAALTIYDMAKRHDRGMEVTSVRLVHKSCGLGEWPMAAKRAPMGSSRTLPLLVSLVRTPRTPSFLSPSTSITSWFHSQAIFGFALARCCITLLARRSSRRWITVTLLVILVRNSASSMAVSPPPTTPTSLPRKKKPSQVAQAETPWPESCFSEGMSSHLADAPVAMITDSASISWPPPSTLKGRLVSCTLLTSSSMIRVPNRSAWARNSSIISGPRMPLGKPG